MAHQNRDEPPPPHLNWPESETPEPDAPPRRTQIVLAGVPGFGTAFGSAPKPYIYPKNPEPDGG